MSCIDLENTGKVQWKMKGVVRIYEYKCGMTYSNADIRTDKLIQLLVMGRRLS